MELKTHVILVDPDDREIGTMLRETAHSQAGVLHRAISVFLFDIQGRTLLQQRHPEKPLWGGYWSNSCCTHPFPNEFTKDSAARRVHEELGLTAELTFRFKLEYQAAFTEELAEHELVSVYTGNVCSDPVVDLEEIIDWRWISVDELENEFVRVPDEFTPWLKLEWQRLRQLDLV
ncbi:MAG: isopentenyl-diphosphate Delta-isomerase [Gammaproteobacteria bacterium]|nr:isopentenyl-diphosphate Delta-isomerase [Gammaproteobacteria bacterium]MYF53240.1 isopentenyl-diphosphate Delta-isomerase [Gammaproteobacteria bacterium]MYK44538.1 isopentenyl-diphosphate Delta-isomerase [Gammaproteobacteria bacterium]